MRSAFDTKESVLFSDIFSISIKKSASKKDSKKEIILVGLAVASKIKGRYFCFLLAIGSSDSKLNSNFSKEEEALFMELMRSINFS